jgi:two-component system, NtrC family, response regulator HydG
MNNILVVDDDNDTRMLITRFLTRNNYAVSDTDSGNSTLEWMKKNKPDLVLCDFKLDDMTGIQLLGKIKETHPDTIVIIMTGYSNVKDAVEALKLGAYDYITKPLLPEEILMTIKKALAEEPKVAIAPGPTPGSNKIKAGSKSIYGNQYITGSSPEFAEIIKQIGLVAPTNYSVIIYGESGCGKEAIAQQIHQESKRAAKPFVAIDCGALSKELAGSELFGHEKGAFTGALNQKIGSLEIANEGTIFLDEIGNLSYEIQVSLLRVVQERKIRRVGGTRDTDIDVRILIASNINLWEASKEGKFREDLYHRFNEFSIAVPSLRERKQDIMLFAHHFLEYTNAELGKNVKGFSNDVENILLDYVWYGNLRELKNVIKRATLLTDGERIEVKSLPYEINNFSRLQFDIPAGIKKEDQKATTLQSYKLWPQSKNSDRNVAS